MERHTKVSKPRKRGRLRKQLGREYYILKRRLEWFKQRNTFAKVDANVELPYSLIRHKSMLLRPLKDVDMYLQHNKITNLRLAIAPLNKIVIYPGQTFSIWRNVGKPSRRNGFLDGLVLSNGMVAKGVGGGLCQLGNLLYWMALHTPLTVKERWRHSYDVFPDVNRTIPFACGATLSYNHVDLQLRNDTDKVFQVSLWLDDEYLNGEIACSEDLNTTYEVFETDHQFVHQWWGGYTRHNRIWKRITNNTTGEVTEELVTANNAIMMYNPMLSYNQNKN